MVAMTVFASKRSVVDYPQTICESWPGCPWVWIPQPRPEWDCYKTVENLNGFV